jgi:hypothetical protein
MRLCDSLRERSYHSEEDEASFDRQRPRNIDLDARMREERKNAHNKAEPGNDLHDWRAIELRHNNAILHLEGIVQLTSLAGAPQVMVKSRTSSSAGRLRRQPQASAPSLGCIRPPITLERTCGKSAHKPTSVRKVKRLMVPHTTHGKDTRSCREDHTGRKNH